MRLLEDSLSEQFLEGHIKEGDSCIVDVDSNGQVTILGGDGVAYTASTTDSAGIAG